MSLSYKDKKLAIKKIEAFLSKYDNWVKNSQKYSYKIAGEFYGHK